jgi:hypothetical protein
MVQGMMVKVMPGLYDEDDSTEVGTKVVVDDIELGCVREVLSNRTIRITLEKGIKIKAERGQVCIAR